MQRHVCICIHMYSCATWSFFRCSVRPTYLVYCRNGMEWHVMSYGDFGSAALQLAALQLAALLSLCSARRPHTLRTGIYWLHFFCRGLRVGLLVSTPQVLHMFRLALSSSSPPQPPQPPSRVLGILRQQQPTMLSFPLCLCFDPRSFFVPTSVPSHIVLAAAAAAGGGIQNPIN